ncbi:MAG TPA: GyrI-like domain-containing protein [Lachnospiraceae bacterium]|nr:GyrI-like domain-containing protein [Lachnospiraceae bacterium]
MLKIGEFAVLSGISIVMLRNYDKMGLLVPTHIDDVNGYRYYDKDQLVISNQIVAMKSMGFGLEEIKSSFALSGEELQELIQKKIVEKKCEEQTIARQLDILEKTVKLEKDDEGQIALRVLKKIIPATYALSYRKEIRAFHEEGMLWEEVMKQLAMQKISISERAAAVSVWHDRDEENGHIDAEIMLYVEKPYKNVEPLNCKRLKEREVASILFKGSYMQINQINTVVAKWLEANHYEIVSEPFTVYHNSHRENPDENTFLTEICFPIRFI